MSIPSAVTSASSTRRPNASPASTASFWAASRPLTSMAGSASAKPTRCASANARAYGQFCCVICVRMKLHVPLTIPTRASIRLATSPWTRAETIGMPPPQLASNAIGRFWRRARANSSGPRAASRLLLAVTTGLPARSAAVTCSAATPGPADQFHDDVHGRVGDGGRGVGRQTQRRAAVPFARLADDDVPQVERDAGPAAEQVAVVQQQVDDAAADHAAARAGATPTVRCWDSWGHCRSLPGIGPTVSRPGANGTPRAERMRDMPGRPRRGSPGRGARAMSAWNAASSRTS